MLQCGKIKRDWTWLSYCHVAFISPSFHVCLMKYTYTQCVFTWHCKTVTIHSPLSSGSSSRLRPKTFWQYRSLEFSPERCSSWVVGVRTAAARSPSLTWPSFCHWTAKNIFQSLLPRTGTLDVSMHCQRFRDQFLQCHKSCYTMYSTQLNAKSVGAYPQPWKSLL